MTNKQKKIAIGILLLGGIVYLWRRKQKRDAMLAQMASASSEETATEDGSLGGGGGGGFGSAPSAESTEEGVGNEGFEVSDGGSTSTGSGVNVVNVDTGDTSSSSSDTRDPREDIDPIGELLGGGKPVGDAQKDVPAWMRDDRPIGIERKDPPPLPDGGGSRSEDSGSSYTPVGGGESILGGLGKVADNIADTAKKAVGVGVGELAKATDFTKRAEDTNSRAYAEAKLKAEALAKKASLQKADLSKAQAVKASSSANAKTLAMKKAQELAKKQAGTIAKRVPMPPKQVAKPMRSFADFDGDDLDFGTDF